jgi:FkbM family methyltransferase
MNGIEKMDAAQNEATQEVLPARKRHGRAGSLIMHMGLQWLDRLGWVPSRTTTYLGRPFVYPFDSVIGRQIARGEQWDDVLATIIPALLPVDDPVICEVGSNIGASLLQIKKVKSAAHVLAFEPSNRFRPFLERNVKLAGLEHVEISSLLVGRSSGTTWLYNNASSASASHASYARHRPRRKQQAAMTTLDEMFRQRPRVDMIKVDTDGFDFEVLRGAEETLKRDSPILFFEFFPALLSTPANDLAWLQSAGYAQFVCFTPDGKSPEVMNNVDQAITYASANTYCDILVCREGAPSPAKMDALVGQLSH